MEEEKRSPLVSIIMPVYNQIDLVGRALDSIPAREDVEVIVVDDGSTDGTSEFLLEYERSKRLPNFKLFKIEKNLGKMTSAGNARNVGFDNATGHWLYALDSDDYYDTDGLNLVLDNLDKFEDFDIVHIFPVINNGEIWTYQGLCAFWTYFVKRDFFGDMRCDQICTAEDRIVLQRLRAKGAKEITIKEPVYYHYNYPRENSIMDLYWKRVKGHK